MIHEVSRIFTNGCFDVLHRGHIELLSYCKTLGTVTVGLNSDASVRNLKVRSRPKTVPSFITDWRAFLWKA
jgi:D-beta-D-heptose 7-phosphate kinase/D-beta-D-heptose 1-phosphate adenosyltransferase